jgi:hypothetical protein
LESKVKTALEIATYQFPDSFKTDINIQITRFLDSLNSAEYKNNESISTLSA